MSDERVGPCGEHCAVVDECDARGREITRLRAENEKLREQKHDISVALKNIRAENEKLRQAMHDIYEIYAGSEGIPRPVTMSEAYLCDLMMQMVAIAAKHKRAAALKETGDANT